MSDNPTAMIDAERTAEEQAVAQAASDQYDASNVDVLRDFERHPPAPGHVYRRHRREGPAPSGL